MGTQNLSTETKSAKLKRNSEEIAKIISSSNVYEKDYNNPYAVYAKIKKVKKLFHLIAERMALEFVRVVPDVEIEFSVPILAGDEVLSCSGYDRTRNVVRVDFVNATIWRWEVIYYELIHELRHKYQMDGAWTTTTPSIYRRYDNLSLRDLNMFWHLDEGENDAETFAYLYGKEILMGAVNVNASKRIKSFYRYGKSQFVDFKLGRLRGKLRYAVRKPFLKEGEVASDAMALFAGLVVYMKNNANQIKLVNARGGESHITIANIKKLLKVEGGFEDFLNEYNKLKINSSEEQNESTGVLDNIGVMEEIFLLNLFKQRKNINHINNSYKLTNVYLKSVNEDYGTLVLINEETVDFLYKTYKNMYTQGAKIDGGNLLSFGGQKKAVESYMGLVREDILDILNGGRENEEQM